MSPRRCPRRPRGLVDRIGRTRAFIAGISLGLVAGAVDQQLRLPKDKRTWNGRVAGVPYDFRVPTPDRFLETYWNPRSKRLFTDRAFGLGWGVNFYRVVALARGLAGGRRRQSQAEKALPPYAPPDGL